MRRGSLANKLRRKSGAERLVAALNHQEFFDYGESGVVDLGAQGRTEALAALGELGDGQTFDAVAECLADPVPSVRHAAVRALSEIDAARALDELIQGVISWPEPPYGEARREAVRTLLLLEDAGVPERFVQAAAASNGSTELDGITRSAVVHLASDPEHGGQPNEIVALMIDLLRRAEGNRRNLEVMLAWLGDHAVHELVDGLREPELRESAAIVLGALRESRAVPGLVDCLEDERADVRLASAHALSQIRDVRAVEGLMRAVLDPDFEVRRQAQEALDALGTIGMVAGVSAVLQLAMKRSPEQLPKPEQE